LKNRLIISRIACFRQKGGGKTENRKITAFALLSLVACAAVMGGYLWTVQAADTDAPPSEDALGTSPIGADNNYLGALGGGFGGRGFGRGHGGGPMAAFGGFGPIEVSEEFEQKIISIAENDSDVQNLLADGYNITAIRPIIKSVVDADGYVTRKATSAIVMLQKDTTDTSGCASVSVDVEAEKVTQVVIMTRTVIDKS
jgi:hypothetical protein